MSKNKAKPKQTDTNWHKWFKADDQDRCIANLLMQRDANEIKNAAANNGWRVVCKTRGTTHFTKV